MTKPSRHIIRRQVLEVVSSKVETEASQLQEQAKMIYNKYFLPAIERCFAKIDIPNRHIRLDCFVIDIDKGDLINLDTVWLEKAVQKLEHDLMQALEAASNSNPTKLGDGSNSPELPSNFVQSNKVGESLQKDKKRADLSSTFGTQNNRNLSDSDTPLSFLSTQIPLSPLNELLSYFLTTGQLSWWADESDRQIIDKTVIELLEKQPQNVLVWLKNDYYRARFMRHVSDETLILLCETIEIEWVKNINNVKKGLKTYTNQTERILFWEKIFIEIGILENNEVSIDKANLNHSINILENTPPQYSPEKGIKKIDKEAQQESENAIINRGGGNKKKSEQPLITKTVDEHLYIQNAGLVLLAAYLPMFFENSGWVVEKKFIDEEKAEMAVQVLQYLADGQDDTPEFLLALPKILCGFTPDALLSPERGLNDEEKEEADSFLMAILENTPELGLKTPDALRGSFLLRQGVLEQTESQWILHVEVETFDLILHKIPWNFQITKLAWMKMPIFIDWALPNF